MFIKKLIIGILCFYTFDTRARFRNGSVSRFTNSIEYSIETTRKKEIERRKSRSYKNKKWAERKKYRHKSMSLKGTRAKDHRYSNQQKIRRMFRNS